jgi:hypothetical protein
VKRKAAPRSRVDELVVNGVARSEFSVKKPMGPIEIRVNDE